MGLIERAKASWCLVFHTGKIGRDIEGRINWRCTDCGRWSAKPVPKEIEDAIINEAIAKFRDAMK